MYNLFKRVPDIDILNKNGVFSVFDICKFTT